MGRGVNVPASVCMHAVSCPACVRPPLSTQREYTVPAGDRHLLCRARTARQAVSGESVAEPGAFLTGENSSSRTTSTSVTFSAMGMVSNINSSSFNPCRVSRICTQIFPLMLRPDKHAYSDNVKELRNVEGFLSEE